MKYGHGTIYQTIKDGKKDEIYVFFSLLDYKADFVNDLGEFLKIAKAEGLRLYYEDTVYEDCGTIRRTFDYRRKGITG